MDFLEGVGKSLELSLIFEPLPLNLAWTWGIWLDSNAIEDITGQPTHNVTPSPDKLLRNFPSSRYNLRLQYWIDVTL